MQALSLCEAQLFRILTAFFGRENVVIGMSVKCVCGGELPEARIESNVDLARWAESNTCLFTIVDGQDTPRLVMEFCGDFTDGIEFRQVEHQHLLKPILQAKGLPYVTINDDEFNALTSPTEPLDFYLLLKEKVEPLGIAL